MSIASFIGVLLVAIAPINPLVLTDRVDKIEYNHYHDEAGRPVFDQLIFYDWDSRAKRFQVRAWRLVKSPSQIPQKDHHTDKWYVLWHDTGVLRKVTSNSVTETWTQYDPELGEREYLPQEKRDELRRAADLPPSLPLTNE